jgi:putative oxidoreductase
MTTTFILAVPRIVVGLLMAGHGLQKLAGWFGGPGLNGIASLLDTLQIRQASRWAVALGLAETLGGATMALGLFQPLGQIAVATVLIVAIVLMHWQNGLWNTNGGIEFPLVMATVAIVLAATPVGASLDEALGISVPAWLILAFTIGAIAAALCAIAMRGPADEPATQPASPAQADRGSGVSTGTRRVMAMRFAAWRREIRIGR